MSLESLKKHRYIITICFVFVILYSLLSLVNHYFFRTYALDLGLYTNAAYKYAHFLVADSSMIKDFYEPILGGHFDLYLLIFSPLTFLFGTYTLLIVQIMALIFGGVGIYRFFQVTESKKKIPYYAAIYFYLFFGVYSALSFDYHSVVVASSVIPWFFLAIYRNNRITSTLLLLFMLISQENFALFAFFICIGLLIEYRSQRRKVNHLLFLSLVAMVYFIAVMLFIIPSLSANGEYGGFLYSSLGENIFEAGKTLLTEPFESLKILFTNHNNSPQGDFIKAEMHIILVLSGLLLLVKKPQYLLMLIPIYFQKFFHDNYIMWSIDAQYNIEFTPILTIGIFKVIAEFKREKLKTVVSVMVLLFTLSTTIRIMDSTVLFNDKSRIRIYQKQHYQRDYNVENVHNFLSKIPKDAKVSAQSPFVPHLSLREHIYLFPLVKDAEYLVYSENESHYPLSKNDFESKIKALESSKNWDVICNEDVTILKHVHE